MLILCLAPEIDTGYETLYSYISNDVGKKRPTVNLCLTLFSDSFADRIAKRNFIAAKSRLVRNGWLHLIGDGVTTAPISPHTVLQLDEQLVSYLLESDVLGSRVGKFASLAQPNTDWDSLIIGEPLLLRLKALSRTLSLDNDRQSATVIQLAGRVGSGRKLIASAISSDLNRPLLSLDAQGLIQSETNAVEFIEMAFAAAKLEQATLVIDNAEAIFRNEKSTTALVALTDSLNNFQGLTFLIGETHWQMTEISQSVRKLALDIPSPEHSERVRLWTSFLEQDSIPLKIEEVQSLAGNFRLTGGLVKQVVASARDQSYFASEGKAQPGLSDFQAASRWHSDQRIGDSARKIQPSYAWDDIVLPNDQESQLREICNYFSNMALVYERWGFQSKTSLGKGLNILFAGSSGTGKTMSADIMAGELGLDLYKIDLSGIVSKYIGETEKNLDRIFREAQDSNAILFFDEADALFGKRSEVKDSHDRYANIEISYLLQKMEEYQGIVILATNFRKNMDDAFVRRMHFAIEFPTPEEEDRMRIWERVFPDNAPMAKDLDLKFVAKQFKIAGGNIKNVAVTSAFLAAQESSEISMKHLMLATKREYQKMGKLLVESEFGPYFELVQPTAHSKGKN